MDYNRVALFVRVVEAGSFTGAADIVGIPKSSVSRSISRLESELGVRLLHRTARRLALTDAGQVYYDSVRGAVAGIDEADAAAREHGAAPSGPVRLTAPPDLADDLGAILAAFARKYPRIKIEIALTSRMVDLVAEGFDVAVRAGRLADSTLIARRIGDTRLILFGAPSYLRRRGRPRALADLADHDWVLYRAHGGRATVRATGPDGAESSVDVAGALFADALDFCRAAASAGAGLALLPAERAIDSVQAGQLEPLLADWSFGGGALHVVIPSASHVPARVALLRDHLVAGLTRVLGKSLARCTAHQRA